VQVADVPVSQFCAGVLEDARRAESPLRLPNLDTFLALQLDGQRPMPASPDWHGWRPSVLLATERLGLAGRFRFQVGQAGRDSRPKQLRREAKTNFSGLGQGT